MTTQYYPSDLTKNSDGRKRHIVVDSMGLLLAVLVTAASVDAAAAAPALFARLEGQPMGKVARMFADRSTTTTSSTSGSGSMRVGT